MILSYSSNRDLYYHYDTGIASPKFGHILDNSDISLEETVGEIVKVIGGSSKRASD